MDATSFMSGLIIGVTVAGVLGLLAGAAFGIQAGKAETMKQAVDKVFKEIAHDLKDGEELNLTVCISRWTDDDGDDGDEEEVDLCPSGAFDYLRN